MFLLLLRLSQFRQHWSTLSIVLSALFRDTTFSARADEVAAAMRFEIIIILAFVGLCMHSLPAMRILAVMPHQLCLAFAFASFASSIFVTVPKNFVG